METDGINALNPYIGIAEPVSRQPFGSVVLRQSQGPVIDYLTRPMVPSPASRRRDTLKGIAQFLPFISGELAKAEGDKLGVALSGLDFLGAAGAPAKAVVKKGVGSLDDKNTIKLVHGTTADVAKQIERFGEIQPKLGSFVEDMYITRGDYADIPPSDYPPLASFFSTADDPSSAIGAMKAQIGYKLGKELNDPISLDEIKKYGAVVLSDADPRTIFKMGEDYRPYNLMDEPASIDEPLGFESEDIVSLIPQKPKKVLIGDDLVKYVKKNDPEFAGIQSLTKKVEKPKKVKKLKPKETEQLFSGIESTKRESLDAPYKNPIIDLVNERPELTQLSKSALDPNEDGVVSLFRVYNLKEGQELLPEKGIASLSTDVAPALAIGQKMEFIRGGGFNPMSLGPETPEFTIKRPAKLIRYEVPIDRVKAHVPSLLDQVPARTANAEKNYKFMSASDEKEVLADLSGIQPAEIFDVPFRAGARYFKGDIPAYRPSPYDIEKGEDPTRVLNYGLFRLFEEGRTPKGLMRDIMKSGSPKFRREPKSAYMSYKNYLAKVAADEANPSRRPGSFSGGEKTYAELNPGVSPYQLYGPEDYPMPIASRPRAKQDYQDLLDAFEEYKKIKGIGSL